MTRVSFRALPAPVVVAVAIDAFVLLALPGATGAGAVFAAALLGLVAAAAFGPCSFDARRGDGRTAPAARGALAAVLLAVCLAGVGLHVALVRGGPAAGALLVGLFCGLYAFTCGAVAHALGGGLARVVVAGVALALLATFFYWDALFLAGAANRKGSAATAFWINPAAAASVTLGFDWIHAKALYTNNQTAESLFGVGLRGVGPYGFKLAAVAAPAAVLGLWRKP